MVVAMLAADEESPEDLDALRATGYLARNFKLLSREKWMQDVVDHTGQAFLGVTIGCARCHDHMYDPLLQKEYYRLRAIFEPHQVRMELVPGVLDTKKDGIPRAYDAQPDAKTRLFTRGDDRYPAGDPLAPGVPESLGGSLDVKPVALPLAAIAPSRRKDVIRAEFDAPQGGARRAEVALAEGRADVEGRRRDRAGAAGRRRGPGPALRPDRGRAGRGAGRSGQEGVEGVDEGGRARRRPPSARWRSRRRSGPRSLARQARRKSAPAKRAEADKALADALKALATAQAAARQPASTAYAAPPRTTYPAASTGRRLAFARWIADESNPLTARVAVNHIWGRHFGRAIVPTVNDFGRNGQPPSHPALLDWLAAELMDGGWSMKAIHRLIVTSAAYRRDSRPDPADLARDPDDVFLWRWMPRRAEAEVVRDCVFAVAGALDSTMGGHDIDHEFGLTVPRRSLYFQHAAEKQMEFLQIFDAPGVTECYRRKESILPQQALALANSELSLRMARRLAGVLSERAGSDPSRVRHGRVRTGPLAPADRRRARRVPAIPGAGCRLAETREPRPCAA